MNQVIMAEIPMWDVWTFYATYGMMACLVAFNGHAPRGSTAP